jgi:formylglycine-generating enzyme required for sulfatase activity/tRNA A-37 threonylcarbamoyl transferase component Bud32
LLEGALPPPRMAANEIRSGVFGIEALEWNLQAERRRDPPVQEWGPERSLQAERAKYWLIMNMEPGQTILNGKYRIERLIGEGGMARVWLAEELTFGGRQVALKEPRHDLLPELAQEVRLRYQREVQVCSALGKARVPNIVRAITAEPYEDGLLLVMEYMPGGDLAALLKESPIGLPVERAVSIALDVLLALEGVHAHELDIVHRDIKPSNILFDAQGTAHLADFGLAQLAGVSGRSQLHGGQHPGTPLYMAPEQARGPDPLNPAADLFALGCVLFEMLTGRRYKRYRPGTRASSLRPGAASWLDEVLARALAEDAWDRYAEAGDMAADLERARGLEAESWRRAAEEARREAKERAMQEVERAWHKVEERALREAQEPARQEVQEQALRAVETRAHREAARQSRRKPGAAMPAWVWAAAAVALSAAALGLILTLWSGGGDTPATALPTAAVALVPTVTTTSVPATAETAAVTWTPMATPTPKVPRAGATQTRSQDGMVMVYVPAGKFSMGSDGGDSDEKPVHTVTLDAYWIDRTEVTNAQYRKCVDAGACTAPAGASSYTRGSYYGNSSFDAYPVINVDWNQAQAYCRWAGGQLPTEAEWEKAARGTDGRIYPWGNQDPDCNRANYWGKDGGCVGDTSRVGSYPSGASPYGALDMAGNVWEWVADWYATDYYGGSPGENPPGPGSGQYRVLRGGSWYRNANGARCAYRGWITPVNWYNFYLGFRCVLSPTPSP